MRWLLRGLLSLFVVLGGLLAVGVVYQNYATARDQKLYSPPGEWVDVGGYRMHIHCMGEGSPTVILDHVGGANSAQWALIQPVIAEQTRVCAYDRAGFGWSEPGPDPIDTEHNAQQLHALLTNAEVEAPYVLVGHSYGAGVARVYNARYPEDVAGIVLVDPGMVSGRPGVPEDVDTLLREEGRWIMMNGPYLAPSGLGRLAAAMGALPGHADLPSPQGEAFDAMQRTNLFYQSLKRQYFGMPATSAQVLAAEASLRDTPLIVLSAELPLDNRVREVFTATNAEIAAYAANGVHRVVPGSDHMSLAIKREHAQATTDAILEMMALIAEERSL